MCIIIIIIIFTCRTTHGKGNEQFMHSLIELLRVTCNMMAKECPEGELVAPKAVSIHVHVHVHNYMYM